MKKPTISIGIPAYNEEANIGILLSYLLRQKQSYGILKEIIVVSDGSTDKTVTIARSVPDKRIRVINRKKRLGMNLTQNEIVKRASGDILVLLNGDIVPVNHNLIDQLVRPFILRKNIGLVGGNTAAVSAHTFVEWALNAGHEFKQNLYVQLHKSETLYLCHGRVRAFAKDLYKQIEWPQDCPEDAYSFLCCQELGFRFVFSRWGRIYFRSPQTIAEHAKQSMRFINGQTMLFKYFPESVVRNAYVIPQATLIKTLLWYLGQHPISMMAYLFVMVITRMFYMDKRTNITTWEISHTSKQVV